MSSPRTWPTTWSVLRLAMAAAIAAAVVAQLTLSVSRALQNGQDAATVAANFFSFFTILSNTGTAVVLAWAGVWYLTDGRRRAHSAEPRGIALALACVATYMIVTGLVYNLLLRGIELPQGSEPIPWSNETLHVVAPAFLLLDVLFAPLRRRLPWRAVWAVIVFPIAWVLYTLIRGPLVVNPITGDSSWYPYPFLNPAEFDNGYAGVAVYVVGIAAAIVAVAFFVVFVSRRRSSL